ncbi:MAG: ABC transporter substrate-binding protein [Oscillospiraceae bacterium]|nr:ABC transporter substrate-binding protein [Oscillospiraceae bacterium]
MRKRAEKWIACLLVLALGLSLGACTLRPKPVKREGDYLFRMGFSSEPDALNPYTASNDEAAALFSLLYDTLLSRDPETGEIAGQLCESWSVADSKVDGARILELTLRSGVQWHDGTALTAGDVEFSLQSLKDFSARYSYPDCETLDTTGIAVIDDTHLRIMIWSSAAEALEGLCHVPILPRHIWNERDGMSYGRSGVPEDYSAARTSLAAAEGNGETLVGSGPFVWDGQSGNTITLRRNESYWNGVSAPGTVMLYFGLADPGAALSAGKLDACWDMSGAWFEELGRERGYHLAGGAGETLYSLFLNLSESSSGSRATLRDTNVRWAIEYCLDKADILNIAFGGGVPRCGWLAADSPQDYEGTLTSLRNYSTASAAWLLDNTGYTDPDGDGVRQDAYGSRLSFTLLCSSGSDAWARAGELLRSSFAEAGMELTVSVLTPNELARAVAAGEYDLLLTGIRASRDPATAFRAFYGDPGNAFSSASGIASPGWNFTGYRAQAFDTLYQNLLDEDEAGGNIPRIGQLLYDDAASLPIGFGAVYQGCSATWEGLVLWPGSRVYFNADNLGQQLLRIAPAGSKN